MAEKITFSGSDTKGSLEHVSPTSPTKPHNASQESLADTDGYGSANEHIFSDPTVANHWRGVYEGARYENRHRFDPDLKWTAEEERKLVRKIDLRIMLWAWIMFCALDMHRRNINRAIADNMLEEIGMFHPTHHPLRHDYVKRIYN